MPALQGFIVEWPFATPMIGFSKSRSPKPTARSIARFGERATPCVMRWLRLLSGMGKILGGNAYNRARYCIADPQARRFPHGLAPACERERHGRKRAFML